MHKTLLLSIAGLSLFCAAAQADVMALPQDAAPATSASASISLPVRGETKSGVRKRFGEPTVQHKPAGGDTRRHPPITRWDYPGFSVFFERGNVIDAVVKDQPATIHRTEELKPAQ